MIISIFSQQNIYAVGEKIVLASDIWCPFVCAKGNEKGYYVELMEKAFSYSKIDVEIRLMPKHQAIDMLKKGKIQGIIGIPKDEVYGLEYSKNSAIDIKVGIFALQNVNWGISDVSVLANQHIGVNSSFSYSGQVEKLLYRNYFSEKNMISLSGGLEPAKSNIDLLINKKVVAIIDSLVVLNYQIRKHKYPIKLIGNVTSEEKKLYVAFDGRYPRIKKYVKDLDENLSFMQSVGETARLEKKYISEYEH